MKTVGLTFLFFIASLVTVADNRIDSLLNVASSAPQDSVRIHAMQELFFSYEYTDIDKARNILGQAMELAKRSRLKRSEARIHVLFGFFAADRGNYEEALGYYKKALVVYRSIGDKQGMANTYNNLGSENLALQNFEEALKMYSISLELKVAINDQKGLSSTLGNIGLVYTKMGNYPEALKNFRLAINTASPGSPNLASGYHNMGMVYYSQGNYPEALEYYLKALKIREKNKELYAIAYTYHCIGAVYFQQGNMELALKNYRAALDLREMMQDHSGVADCHSNMASVLEALGKEDEALTEMTKARRIYEQLGNKAGIAGIETNLGLHYINKGQYKEALERLMVASSIEHELGQKPKESESFTNIATALTRLKRYDEARSYYDKAISTSREIVNKINLKSAYIGLFELDSIKGDHRSAYENYKLHILYRDSLNNEESRKKMLQSQMNYDFEKKEAIAKVENQKELEKQELLSAEKSRKQDLIIGFVLVAVIFVIGFAAFIFRSLRITRKQRDIMELQRKEAEDQKMELEHQKGILEEKQKEIIDSINYAKRIQRSQMASERYILSAIRRLTA